MKKLLIASLFASLVGLSAGASAGSAKEPDVQRYQVTLSTDTYKGIANETIFNSVVGLDNQTGFLVENQHVIRYIQSCDNFGNSLGTLSTGFMLSMEPDARGSLAKVTWRYSRLDSLELSQSEFCAIQLPTVFEFSGNQRIKLNAKQAWVSKPSEGYLLTIVRID